MFDLNSLFKLLGAGLTIATDAIQSGFSPSTYGKNPNYNAPIETTLVPPEPLTEDQKKQGNQIILGIIGAVAIGGVMIYLSTTKKKHAA